MIYLASPYTHPDPKIREERFQAVCLQASIMMRRGITVFSPIAHMHPIAQYGMPVGWEFWKVFDTEFLEMCSELHILKLPGFKESKGVLGEIQIAESLGKPVVFIEPEEKPRLTLDDIDDAIIENMEPHEKGESR